MKRLFKCLSVASLLLLSCLGFAQQNHLPDFHFLDTDHVPVGKKDIPKGKALLLIYFRSDCDHCEHTAMQLKEAARKYPAVIWMVSGEEIPALHTFESLLDLYDIPNLKVLQDNNHQMHRFYDFTQLPFIALYSPSGKLLKQFDELPSIDVIKKTLTGK
jgi:peroxiredoxin